MAILKPGKDPANSKTFRSIALLCHKYKPFETLILNRLGSFLDQHFIPEQAGFRSGKILHKPAFESRSIHGAAFVGLSWMYVMVNHRILVQKLFQITKDVRLTKLIQNMLASRCFFVDLAGKCNRWHREKSGLPQCSVLAPLLFNIYTNDHPIHPNTRSFLHADDLGSSKDVGV